MLRDVFYYGVKPNIHPRERFATSLQDARNQCTTEHFWIINEFCDYKNFDWDFDFDFLPDEDVWTEDHNNVWPSVYQKDSGTWLCSKKDSDIIIYRNDVEPLRCKNEKNDYWEIIQPIDESKFDFGWHPDPTSPPYIYVWGNKYISGVLESTIEYHVEGATDKKYMSDDVEVLPQLDRWKEIQRVDKSKFDFSWRPDPREPAYIYVWGNKWYSGEIEPALEYHTPGATDRKYLDDVVEIEPEWDKYRILGPVDKSSFDFTWRPDPREPAYIYVWGNQWNKAEIEPTVEYHCEGATERKYMHIQVVKVLPEMQYWKTLIPVTNFDYSWRPDPTSPPFIYVFGNQWNDATTEPTVEYHMPGAKDRKFITDVVATVAPSESNWHSLIPVESFDYSWRPNPYSPPYIYVFGNQWNDVTIEPTLEYRVPGATEKKIMPDMIAKVAPTADNWKTLIPVESFDYSWRPNPNDPPYIYVFGNQWNDATTEPTVEYHRPGATDRKYVTDIVATVGKVYDNWKTLIPIESFDYSWRPNPYSPPYIYVFGNQWNDATNEPTVEYHAPGASQRKYINDLVATVKSTSDDDNWKILIPVESFDFSWRPNPYDPPYIYVFGNKWNDAATEPTIEYHVEGATEYKYVNSIVAIPKVDMALWATHNEDDLLTFDFSWRPNPYSPPQIYQWRDNGPRYSVPGAKDVVLMDRTEQNKRAYVNRYVIKTTLEDLINEHPDEVFWALNPDLKYDRFDFTWRPDHENFRHVNVFGNEYSKDTQTYYVNAPLYLMGYKEYNYVEDQIVNTETKLSMFFIDRGNVESNDRFNQLKEKYPHIIKTRYLNSWVDTITRCVNKAETNLFWVLSSELDYSEFEFDFYPSPWQMKMIHVFGTQWSHWGNTYMVNKTSFIDDTKYVKIIEHLSMLNFVKTKRARAVNRLYDVITINHGNMTEADKEGKIVVDYENSYLNTFRKILKTLPEKKEHYVWITSSICDYSNFDFSYISDPFARQQLHVFPSDKQKFGDTFLVDVNKLRELIADMNMMEDYGKINYNQHQRVTRLPAPIFISDDTHTQSLDVEYDFPYAVFKTKDNENLNVIDSEPMNLWDETTKNIIVTSLGGTRIVVPKEAKRYVKKELYDYPYINVLPRLEKSNPLDIVFLSNGEKCADENYEHLVNVTKNVPNRVVRVDGVNGRAAAYHAALNASNTPWAFTVFAKLKVDNKFDWNWQPDRLQISKHYIFYATNPVNGLVYGHQAMIAYHKKLVLANDGNKGLDFTLDDEHEVVELNSGTAIFNTDEFSTWRTAFREAIKLRADNTYMSKQRLNVWITKAEGDFAEYSIYGSQDAVAYYDEVAGDMAKLKLSYEWNWLQDYFSKKYK